MANKRKVAALLLLASAIEDEDEEDNQTTKRRMWVKDWLSERQRQAQGSHDNLMRELALTDPDAYRRYIRMDVHTFARPADGIRVDVQRQDTVMRLAISVAEQLAVLIIRPVTNQQWHRATETTTARSARTQTLNAYDATLRCSRPTGGAAFHIDLC
jgi:hypothetical protein